ncbi:MAG TPA: hypothetical protein VNL70_03760, partial [Tepidisphaeraceae bacterium]|nr:hypothetical protein [Tepidisphaeraceae bacterium]
MTIELNGFLIDLSVHLFRHGHWVPLKLQPTALGFTADHDELHADLIFDDQRANRISYTLSFTSPYRTRLRLRLALRDQAELFHLIPGNIHGDNNAAHVRPGEFPVLSSSRPHERNCAALWEFRADRASHPVSILCCARGAVGISIQPYSSCDDTDEGFIRNGVFAALPDAFGVSLGYGNDPLTFSEKTVFLPATSDTTHGSSARGTIWALAGSGRAEAHRIIRAIYDELRQRPVHARSARDALRALADAFVQVNWSEQLQQYTNRKCRVPVDLELRPWRAVVEIGWTGGSMLAYPMALAEQIFPDLRLPKSSARIFDEICAGYNHASGLINDTALNQFTRDIPEGWNRSTINGWWSGFLPQTRDNHCAYTNAHAAYYMLRLADAKAAAPAWVDTALKVLETAMSLQRDDGAFGYIFSSTQPKVIDWDGFAGCWFAPALIHAWKITGQRRYRDSAERAIAYYACFVRDLACWGSPMDTFKSIDSEGNLAFIRATRLMHQFTGDERYLPLLEAAANYEYLWRYGFRARPQCPPLRHSNWNSCGGTITSVSNPHIHPMGVVATTDLEYLARLSNDVYHQSRADDGIAWLLNTMELYPDVMGYGRYGVLSERTCPSDGLLAERYADTGEPASTWWSY